MYQVINVDTGESHGEYETLERAKGCVIFDSIEDWEIWNGQDVCVLWSIRQANGQHAPD